MDFVLKEEPPSTDEEDDSGNPAFMGFAVYTDSSESEDDEGIIEPVDKVEEVKKVSMAEIIAKQKTAEPEPDTDTDDDITYTFSMSDLVSEPSEDSDLEEENYPPHQQGAFMMGAGQPEQYTLKINEMVNVFNKSYNLKRKNSKLINLLKKYDFQLENVGDVDYDDEAVTLHTFTQSDKIKESGPMSRPEAERFIAELQKLMIKDNPDLLGIHLHTDYGDKLLDETMTWTYLEEDDVDFPGNVT